MIRQLQDGSLQAPTLIADRNRQRRPKADLKKGASTLRGRGPEIISTALELLRFESLQKRNREQRSRRGPDDLGVETGDGAGTGRHTEDSRGTGTAQKCADVPWILDLVQVENPGGEIGPSPDGFFKEGDYLLRGVEGG